MLLPPAQASNRDLLRDRGGNGFALVTVLAFLALVLIVTLAFFSRAQLNRQSSVSSSASGRNIMMANAGLDLIVGDLVHEMAAGSLPDLHEAQPGDFSRRILRPRLVPTTNAMLGTNIGLSRAPSLVPHRVIPATNGNYPGNLVKQSLANRAFFQQGPGITNTALPPIPYRASSLNTAANFPHKGSLNPTRWNLPGFASGAQTVPPPDWIYFNRAGDTPTVFSQAWADRTSGNPNYILGRFAYNIYDIGGLLDINLIGNLLEPAENERRGRLHQVSLSGEPGDLAAGQFPEFVLWRSQGDEDSSQESGGLFDPRRNFALVPQGGQGMVGRRDLIRYLATTNSLLPSTLLPFLTVFNRAWDAPMHEPEPNRPLLPDNPPAAEMNPALAAVRFAGVTVLARGADAPVTVPAGSPVFARRFPLGKIALLADPGSSAADLIYYFGLVREEDGSFRYAAHSDDARIKRLDEIAEEGREPNFFEVLQAAIVTGSLGRDAGNAYTISQPYDANRYYQILQIGANIIDQWDENNHPTVISFPMGNDDEFHRVFGIENLPYFNNLAFIAYRPRGEPNRFQVWALFDVWNPHRNAVDTLPDDISDFRIIPSGLTKAEIRYIALSRPAGLSTAAVYEAFNEATAYAPAGFQNIGTSPGQLNYNREIVFGNVSYATPVIVGGGGAPDQAGPGTWDAYQGGALVLDYPGLDPAVPAATLADLPAGGRRAFMQAALEYNWGGGAPTSWGAKAHNWFRFRSGILEQEKMAFELQYRASPSGPWTTYQRVAGILPHSTDPPGVDNDTAGLMAGADVVSQARGFTASEVALTTHQSATDPAIAFYGWRNATVRPYSFNMSKFDPRTNRFGLNGNAADPLGRTIRQSIAPYSISTTSATQFSWRLWSSYFVVGKATSLSVFGDKGFDWLLISPTASTPPAAAFGLIQNVPEGALGAANVGRYRDRDGIVRPADGYLGSVPTAVPLSASGPGSKDDRPLILNRPFRSVGELGYAFRDLPWKTVDFFSRNSGDLGLLDAFSLDESPGDQPAVSGRINLNSAPPQVLEALLSGVQTLGENKITKEEAASLAAAIVAEREANGPFFGPGDLVARVLTPRSAVEVGDHVPWIQKTAREAAIRTLAALGQTRTWNFLVDLQVQTGRMSPTAGGPEDFLPTSSRRYWVHLALDRLTGEVLESQWETVDE